jgi:23S rRNA pseudouridine2605 synthase
VVGSTPRLSIDGRPVAASRPIHLMLNKPRGLVTTASDEQGRETVYRCLDDPETGWLAPVGRLDKASEGLLLFTNDPEWAARVTDPRTGPAKTYHVQVDTVPDAILLEKLVRGAESRGEHLAAQAVRLIRAGGKNAWLEIVLDEGRNRQIRRLLEAHGVRVLRLVRVAIGDLALGDLGKGKWRPLSGAEAASLVTGKGLPRS